MTNPLPAPDRLASLWGVRPRRSRPDLLIAGSPERVRGRRVLEDEDGSLWILEEIDPAEVVRKDRQAEILEELKRAGLESVHPFRRDRTGRRVAREQEGYWMLRPFVEGVSPERPGYAFEAWRGKAMGAFLSSLRRASLALPPGVPGPPFSLEAFIRDLLDKVRRHDPDLWQGVAPAARCLEERLFPLLGGLPLAFCHGDFHPLNAIWSGDSLRSVIDWEFCGPKTEAHDAALLAGCVGMEDPRALGGPFVPALLGEVRSAGLLSPASLSVFFELVLAVRFQWLSEWLRGRDMEMARMELDYLDLLLAKELPIRKNWELTS